MLAFLYVVSVNNAVNNLWNSVKNGEELCGYSHFLTGYQPVTNIIM
jgi:hypothetical protein